VAHEGAQLWRELQEQQPLKFFDRILLPELVRTLCVFAPLIGADPRDVVFLQNATTGLNTVMTSLEKTLGKDDEVVGLSIGYGAVKTMLKRVCARTGARYCEVPISLPLTPTSGGQEAAEDRLLRALAPRLSSSKTKLVVLDHVASNSALVLPIKRLAALCKREAPQAQLLVDGAHGLLAHPLDMAELQSAGVDFYVSNCHKWFSSGKGASFLWARRDRQPLLEPLVLSHGGGQGFTSDFVWDGCHDYSALLTLPMLQQLWSLLGCAAVRDRNNQLAASAMRLLASQWQTDSPAPASMFGCMGLVRLPNGLFPRSDSVQQGRATSEHAKKVQDYLYDNKIEVPIKCLDATLYVRVSAHIYNHLPEYQVLADAIQRIR
jgi:isopenicillin-N epimerase